MRSLGTRRAGLVAGAAAMAAVALAGCSAGQVAETALKRPSNQGVNVDNSDHSVVIRNLAITYNGPTGYQAKASAPLEFSIHNQTTRTVRVTVSTGAPDPGAAGLVYGTSVGLVGPAADGTATAQGQASPEPSASVEPSASADSAPANPAPKPATLTLPPLGSVVFQAGDPTSIQLIGLTGKLVPGTAAGLTFAFDNGAEPLSVQAPVGTPLSPAPRGTGDPEENFEQE